MERSILSSVIFALLLALHAGAGAEEAAPRPDVPAAQAPQTSQTGEEVRTVRFGVLEPLPGHENLTYQPGESNVVDEVMRYLEKRLPDWRIEVKFFSPASLAEAIKSRAVSFALMSAGQYVELAAGGVHPLASIRTARYPDPNRVSGALFVTTWNHPGLNSIPGMKGARVLYNERGNFINGQIPRAEIAAAGFNPDRFFSSEAVTNNHPSRILEMLLEGRADVGVFRVCELEALVAKRPEWRGLFRPVYSKKTAGEVCERSTDLYPGWTMTATPGVPPDLTKRLTLELLEMPAGPGSTISWSVATEFERVNEVFRRIGEGPYAYLRAWTVRRVVVEFWPLLLAAAIAFGVWIAHSMKVERLAQARARELAGAYLKLEDQAEAAGRAEARAAALTRAGSVGQLSSIFAHEMGQPLSASAYRLMALRSLLAAPTPDRRMIEENLDALDALNERAARILDKVRSYAKGRADRSAPVRLDLVLENVLKELSRRAGPKGIAPGRIVPATVPGDELELFLALYNIVKNALEARAERLKAGGRAGPVRVELDALGDRAVFRAENDGAVLSAADVEGLLAPAGSRKPDGIGLGLLIVDSVVRAHHGKLRFEARREGGLVVTLSLPFLVSEERKA